MVDSPASSKAQNPMKDLLKSVTLIKFSDGWFGWNLEGNMVQGYFSFTEDTGVPILFACAWLCKS